MDKYIKNLIIAGIKSISYTFIFVLSLSSVFIFLHKKYIVVGLFIGLLGAVIVITFIVFSIYSKYKKYHGK